MVLASPWLRIAWGNTLDLRKVAEYALKGAEHDCYTAFGERADVLKYHHAESSALAMQRTIFLKDSTGLSGPKSFSL